MRSTKEWIDWLKEIADVNGFKSFAEAAKHVEQLQAERDALAAHVERLRIAALNAISFMSGGQYKAELRDAYDETPQQSLAEHDAEVARKAFIDGANWTTVYGLHKDPSDAARQYIEHEYGVHPKQ